MSRCAHAQGNVKLRELPKCSRCKQQLMLVTARYETNSGDSHLAEEWECINCGKAIPREYLKEEEPSNFEKFLHQKSKELNNERKEQNKKSRQKSYKCSLRKQNNKT